MCVNTAAPQDLAAAFTSGPSALLTLLGRRIASSSNFFLAYLAFRALVAAPLRLVIPHVGVRLYLLRKYCRWGAITSCFSRTTAACGRGASDVGDDTVSPRGRTGTEGSIGTASVTHAARVDDEGGDKGGSGGGVDGGGGDGDGGEVTPSGTGLPPGMSERERAIMMAPVSPRYGYEVRECKGRAVLYGRVPYVAGGEWSACC